MMVRHAGGVRSKKVTVAKRVLWLTWYDSYGRFTKRPAAITMKAPCREGEEGDNFYVIESGQFKATKVDGDKEKLLFTYHGEGAFGELALMYNCPRAATVTVCNIPLHYISVTHICSSLKLLLTLVNIVLLMYKAVCMCWLEVVLKM